MVYKKYKGFPIPKFNLGEKVLFYGEVCKIISIDVTKHHPHSFEGMSHYICDYLVERIYYTLSNNENTSECEESHLKKINKSICKHCGNIKRKVYKG